MLEQFYSVFIKIPKMLSMDKCMESSSTYEFHIIKCISSDLLKWLSQTSYQKMFPSEIWPEVINDFSLWKMMFHVAFHVSGSKFGPSFSPHMIRQKTTDQIVSEIMQFCQSNFLLQALSSWRYPLFIWHLKETQKSWISKR